MVSPHPAGDELLHPGEVAALFAVDPKTVTRWAVSGRLHSITTPGGHRRYVKADVLAAVAARRLALASNPLDRDDGVTPNH